MRRWTVWSAVVFVPPLLLVARDVQGATVFTEDVTFVDGDVDWSVEIHDGAHAEVSGGRFGNRFQLYDDATATLLGGDFRGVFAMGGSSRATMHPGTYVNTYIFMSGSAELDIFGGRMPDRFLDAAAWGGDPRVTFHGYDLYLDPTGGSQGDGLVTGVFADGSAFAVHLRGDETASRVRLAEMKYSAVLRYERAIAKAQREFGKKVADARKKLLVDLDKALPQPSKTARPADVERRSKIRILSAFYGQNVSWLDVTDRVRQATKGKRNWAVQVQTEDWGEPAPGFGGPRTLLIRYSVNGEIKFKSQYQGARITLP